MLDMSWIETRLRGGGTVNGLTLAEEDLLIAHAGGVSAAKELVRRWAAAVPVTPTQLQARPARAETDLAVGDLDVWADDVEPDDGDDDDAPDDTEQTTRTCPTCHGRGRDHSGKSCARCGGSGRVPIDDLPGEPDDEEDEIEETKSYAHEFEEE